MVKDSKLGDVCLAGRDLCTNGMEMTQTAKRMVNHAQSGQWTSAFEEFNKLVSQTPQTCQVGMKFCNKLWSLVDELSQ